MDGWMSCIRWNNIAELLWDHGLSLKKGQAIVDEVMCYVYMKTRPFLALSLCLSVSGIERDRFIHV